VSPAAEQDDSFTDAVAKIGSGGTKDDDTLLTRSVQNGPV
jgi:hypothetical protein